MSEEATCPECGGSSRTAPSFEYPIGKDCPTCHGTGKAPAAAEVVRPDGYAYRYSDGIRFNSGGKVNGSTPTEAMPWFYAITVDKLLANIRENHDRAIAVERGKLEAADDYAQQLLARIAELEAKLTAQRDANE